MWALSQLVQAADFSMPENSVIALAIAGVGGVFAVPAIVSFLLARTTIHPHKPHETRKLRFFWFKGTSMKKQRHVVTIRDNQVL